MTKISRRSFVKIGLATMASTVLTDKIHAATALCQWKGSKSGFTMWQLNTQCNQIGNTYVFLTDKGKVIVMDGGWEADENYLRGFLSLLGGEVDTWFVSHPHSDHITSLVNILKEPRGIKVKRIIHSRFSEKLLNGEEPYKGTAVELYKLLDTRNDFKVIDLHEPGYEEKIDGLNFRILSVTNEEFCTNNVYNNSSMIIRMWDKKKSIVFLGDAGVECGEKVLKGPFRKDLDCDYMQMAHHGQQGCNEEFYRTVNFKACLWSTPKWVWENDFGQGPGSGTLKTADTRRWMDEKGIKEHHISWQGLWKLD